MFRLFWEGFTFPEIRSKNLVMDMIFDDLSQAVAQPRRDVRALISAFALDMAGKLVTGLAIGLGIAVGMALAG